MIRDIDLDFDILPSSPNSVILGQETHGIIGEVLTFDIV